MTLFTVLPKSKSKSCWENRLLKNITVLYVLFVPQIVRVCRQIMHGRENEQSTATAGCRKRSTRMQLNLGDLVEK